MLSAVVYLTLGTLLASFVHERRSKFYFVERRHGADVPGGREPGVHGRALPDRRPGGLGGGAGLGAPLLARRAKLQRRGAVEQEIERGERAGMPSVVMQMMRLRTD